MNEDLDAQMLQSLELLHYCGRFADKLFAFSFERSEFCEEVLVDLRVLHAARIRQVLFCAADPSLLGKLELWNRSGHKFLVLDASLHDLSTAAFIGQLQRHLGEGHLPLVALHDFPDQDLHKLTAQRAVLHCAVCLGAEKVFFPGEHAGLQIDGRFRSYPSKDDLSQALENGAPTNLSSDRLSFYLEQQDLHAVDLVILSAQRGAIYSEVFTHSGSGTLLSKDYPNILRPAQESDVRDIMTMMQPYIAGGLIKPLSEDALLQSIPSFTVYSVNQQIVAAASLIEHEDCYELAKLCTLPRYQARGRARDLVRALQNKAKTDGKRALFALTVQEFVGEFFERLGFRPVDRDALPQSWRAGYDLNRPSRAYWYPCQTPPTL